MKKSIFYEMNRTCVSDFKSVTESKLKELQVKKKYNQRPPKKKKNGCKAL